MGSAEGRAPESFVVGLSALGSAPLQLVGGKTVNLGKDRVSNVANRKVEQLGDTLADQASKAKEFVAEKTPGTSSTSTTAKTSTTEKTSATKSSTDDQTSTSGAPPATATRQGHGS